MKVLKTTKTCKNKKKNNTFSKKLIDNRKDKGLFPTIRKITCCLISWVALGTINTKRPKVFIYFRYHPGRHEVENNSQQTTNSQTQTKSATSRKGCNKIPGQPKDQRLFDFLGGPRGDKYGVTKLFHLPRILFGSHQVRERAKQQHTKT